MAILSEPVRDPHADITPVEAREFLNTGTWGDPSALALAVQDAERAENEENRRSWILGWSQARDLYSSIYTPNFWPGTQIEASSVNFFTVATAVNGINPQILAGLFYENPPFIAQERSGTSAQLARATSALLGYQLEDINFREELRLGGMNFLLFGTAIFQEGWEKFTKERKIVKRKAPPINLPAPIPGAEPISITDDELEVEIIEEVVDRPTFEHIVNLREILVDPGLEVPDIRKAKYVVRRRYMTWDDIDKLRDREGYDIPSREKMLELFLPPKEPVESNPQQEGNKSPLYDARAESPWEATTVDPFQQPLEVLERWDNKTYIVVIQKKLVIYNDRNIYGRIPFLSIGWWDNPGSFWSLGLGRTIGTEQRVQTGITNLMMNIANLKLNAPLVRVRGKSVPTQSIRIGPNKMIEVDAKGDLEPLKFGDPVVEANELFSMSQARVAEVSGNNPITSQGNAGSAGHSNLARSSAGASLLGQGASNVISDCIDKLANQVIVPFLYDVQEMNKMFLPPSQLKFIMSDELQHDYMTQGGDLIDILNARIKFTILAGSKMQARRTMSQGLPLLSQFLSNPAVMQQLAIEGKKVDINELCRMYFEASDWKNLNDVIVPMTPQDLQRQQEQSQAALQQSKGAVQSQLAQQKFNQQQALADQENVARAARDSLRIAWKAAVDPQILTGEPNTGPVGFGGNVS
jgi:hypothetical protein